MKWIVLVLFGVGLVSGVTARAEPIDVFIFSGQSNMGGGINVSVGAEHGGHKDHPAIEWMDSEANDVLYFWDRGRQRTDEWETLTYKTHRQGHWEQFTAYRLWQARQKAGVDRRMAVITVTVGATAMNGFWTAGGRAQREGLKDWIKTHDQGKGNKMLEETVKTALQRLEEKGFDPQLEAFIWYQGEGDSLHLFQAKNYERYLRDLIDGWEERDPDRFKDDRSLYAGSLREWTGDDDFKRIIVRVSDNIQGADSWGPREEWDPALQEVRRAQVDYAESRDDAVWVNVDDLPLSDAFHFHGKEYITIGERVAEAYLDLADLAR